MREQGPAVRAGPVLRRRGHRERHRRLGVPLDFGDRYGVTLVDGPMRGLLARAVVVLDADGVVTYTQLVPEITTEPDYDAAVAALG